jgi:hypothetical protein
MTLRHPSHDLAIVIRNTLGTDSSLFLLALSAFGCGVLAMAATTSLAHLKGIIWREILGTSFDRTPTKRGVGGGETGRRLKVDVIWVVAHPDAGGWAKTYSHCGARPRATTAPTRFPPSEL